MESQHTFDQNVVFYDKHRPTYGQEIFRDIIQYSDFGAGKLAIEVGCGTGQATKPFLEADGKVLAIELGENLAEFARHKFAKHDNFEVVNANFVEHVIDDNSIDLVYSATAFHWVSDGINGEPGYQLAHKMLKPGGCLALWWNTPRACENAELHDALQKCYKKYAPSLVSEKADNFEGWHKKRHENLQRLMRHNGYTEIAFKLYYESRTLTGEDYVELSHTYSDHMMLPENERNRLFDAIGETVTMHGGITLTDTIDLHMGRK